MLSLYLNILTWALSMGNWSPFLENTSSPEERIYTENLGVSQPYHPTYIVLCMMVLYFVHFDVFLAYLEVYANSINKEIWNLWLMAITMQKSQCTVRKKNGANLPITFYHVLLPLCHDLCFGELSRWHSRDLVQISDAETAKWKNFSPEESWLQDQSMEPEHFILKMIFILKEQKTLYVLHMKRLLSYSQFIKKTEIYTNSIYNNMNANNSA